MNTTKKQGAIFAGQTTFAEAFPEIESVEAIVRESGPGNQGLGERRYNRLTFREFLSCSNVACSGRAVALGALLRELMQRRLDGVQVHRRCEGRLEKGGPCPNAFDIQIHLSYKPGSGPGDTPRCGC